ncbi:hypothetical protein Emed_003729 [Eimeria media]
MRNLVSLCALLPHNQRVVAGCHSLSAIRGARGQQLIRPQVQIERLAALQQHRQHHHSASFARCFMTTSSTSSSSNSSSSSDSSFINKNGISPCKMTSLAGGHLLLERTGNAEVPVYTVTLNRPQALNALSLPMLRSLLKFFEDKTNKDALVIVRGSGDKAFCAGGDVREVCLGGSSHAISFFSCEYQLDLALAEEKGPVVVSVWDGIVFGGGVGLSVHAGFRICTEKTTFAMPEVHIGLFPDCGMTQRLASLQPEGLGLFLGLTGAKLKAPDLMLTRLATHYVPSSELEHVLEQLKQGPPKGMNAKEWASQVIDIAATHRQSPAATPPEAGQLLTPEMLQFLRRYFAEPESLQALLLSLKRDAQSCSLCASALQQMESACPLSLAVTFKAIRDRQHATKEQLNTKANLPWRQITSEQQRQLDLKLLREAMAIELVLICNMTAYTNYNFKEGIRALLLDKDKCPKWYFQTLSTLIGHLQRLKQSNAAKQQDKATRPEV